jgi:hypothetical protein
MTTPSAIWRPEVGVEFGKRYLYEIADCLPIVPNMPMRKFPMLMAAAVESFIREAQSHKLHSQEKLVRAGPESGFFAARAHGPRGRAT